MRERGREEVGMPNAETKEWADLSDEHMVTEKSEARDATEEINAGLATQKSSADADGTRREGKEKKNKNRKREGENQMVVTMDARDIGDLLDRSK